MWLPSHIHTVYSLLDGLVKPDKLAKKIKELGYSHCCITDHGNISGSVKFAEYMQEEGIIPVFGNEFYCYETDGNRNFKHTVVLSKNLKGWKKLISLTTLSNKQFYYKPRIKIEQIADIAGGDLLIFSGHPGSIVGDSLNPLEDALKMQKLFGDDFYLEVQAFYPGNNAEKIREVSRLTGIKAIASADVHYLEKKDAAIHRVAICSNLKLTLPDVNKKLQLKEDVPMSGFFKEDCFYLPSNEELLNYNTIQEVDCSEILAKIEKYNILNKPLPPKFKCPEGYTEASYLRQLCRDGWKKRFKNTWNINVYKDRVLRELEVIEEFNLAGYLLVVWDYIMFAKKKGVLVGPGRGSCAGSLVAYLIEVTDVDPIPNNLIFERFINVSRMYSSHLNFSEYPYLDNYKKTIIDNSSFENVKLVELKDNKFYLEELNVIANKTTRGMSYYNHIIKNVELDRSNPNNSYIMWLSGKVDALDVSKPAKIVEERYSLPDVDTDFPPFFRDKIVEYISAKYGEKSVAQILTLGSLKGRSAIKEVARITNVCDFETATIISKCLPEEGKITDEMAEHEEESIIMFTLKHMPNLIKDYAVLVNNEIVGEYSELFRQAVELEGCYKSLGKHAAGIVVSPGEINDECPLVRVGDVLVAGFDMKDLEKIGLIKFDILGVSSLEKLMAVNELLRYGRFVDDKLSHYV